ncbi:MAG: hypothetical protein ACI8QS_002110 [Planctomycetota bacterium]|jgi:hypothetical protein
MRPILLSPVLLVLCAQGVAAQALVFDEISLPSNTLNLSFGRGAAMADIDGDGLMDIVCADAEEPNQFYRQKIDGTFEDAASLWGVGIVAEHDWGVLVADFDNDGDEDIYFANGGFSDNDYPGRPFPNQMLRNDIQSTGLLQDVSNSIGAGMNTNPTFGATALDFDRDGMLDIFCADRKRSCTLLRNTGSLVFADVSSAANIVEVEDWRHAGAADYDNDGWPDVGVGNGKGPNALYHNEQDGTFLESAVAAGVENPFDNFGMVFQDYDNDGLQDIYIPKYQLTPTSPSPVYLNNGDGTFVNVSPGTGMGAHTDMGHESADIDGDGYPEIMMGTGNPSFSDFDFLYHVLPNGSGGLLITDISTVSGFNSKVPSRQHGQAVGDFDRDGDVDIYCNNGGPSWKQNTAQSNFFWRNQGNNYPWLAMELQGVLSNRTGVGVVARATTAEGRDIFRTLQVGRGFTNTPDHALHFGIGTDTAVENVELRWPSGITQQVSELQMGVYTDVVETGMIRTGPAAVGQPLVFEVAGTAGDLAELALSLGTGFTDIPGINGPLLLAAPYLILPAFPLDASGRLTLPIPVPNNTALIGLTLHTQAWIHPVSGAGGTLSQLNSFTLQ